MKDSHLSRRPAFPLALGISMILTQGCVPEPGRVEWQETPGAAQSRPLLPREPCADVAQNKRALFGDLHVHTGFSMDARTRDLRLGPDDAYRFATGGEVELPPYGENGRGTPVRISRPLDFAAVTDHAEFLGEVRLCVTPGSPAYDSSACRIFRGEERSLLARALGLSGFRAKLVGMYPLDGSRAAGICGEDGRRCREAVSMAWQETQQAAEDWYDRTSACRFTTFNAWEYSASPKGTKVHRNVILRNEIVPEIPLSWLDTPSAPELWQGLRDLCTDNDSGCDALSIPHNPNLSNGQIFRVWYRDLPTQEQRAQAALRARMEPVVEMSQIKGSSECRNGMWQVMGEPDEFCDYEMARETRSGGEPFEDCEDGAGWGAQAGRGCRSRLDFVRYALLEGLREKERIGVNPYPIGFIGSTDTHNATPGATDEYDYRGSRGAASATATLRLDSAAWRSPGGLAGVYAEENSREAIFAALRRRETFATSGVRIRPRFFGGWKLPADACDQPDRLALGYAEGVPMGGDLATPPQGAKGPVFLTSALRDPGTDLHPGGRLQRIQIVKGWVGEDQDFHQKVYDVAGSPGNAADVDLATCTPRGTGHDELCSVWRDPDFDPAVAAVYYARVLENPSCRWSWRQCLTLPENDRPEACAGTGIPRTIQERAWTSPIWYEPEVVAAREES